MYDRPLLSAAIPEVELFLGEGLEELLGEDEAGGFKGAETFFSDRLDGLKTSDRGAGLTRNRQYGAPTIALYRATTSFGVAANCRSKVEIASASIGLVSRPIFSASAI